MLNVMAKIATKKTAIEFTQKEMRKEFKHFNTKINYTQKKTVMQEMRDQKKAIRHIKKQRVQ